MHFTPLPGLSDRQWDLWEPLIAIADQVGGAWPGRARAAAVKLCGAANERAEGVEEQLLTDIRDIFGRNGDRVTTELMLVELNAMPERPWPTLIRGRPMDARALASRLRHYKIKTATLHDAGPGGKDAKGYTRGQFDNVFKRYPPPPVSVPPSLAIADTDLGDSGAVAPYAAGTDAKRSNSLPCKGGDGGTDKNAADRGEAWEEGKL